EPRRGGVTHAAPRGADTGERVGPELRQVAHGRGAFVACREGSTRTFARSAAPRLRPRLCALPDLAVTRLSASGTGARGRPGHAQGTPHGTRAARPAARRPGVGGGRADHTRPPGR